MTHVVHKELKQIGIAMHNYHDAHKKLPEGGVSSNPTSTSMTVSYYVSAYATILPYIEQQGLQSLYDFKRPWEQQDPQVVHTIIATVVCPSASLTNPFDDPEFAASGYRIGGTASAVTYLLNKGSHRIWCRRGAVSNTVAGVFELGGGSGFRDIRDGTSNTMMVGEGPVGDNWHVCQGQGCSGPAATNPFGDVAMARISWVVPHPNAGNIGLSPHISIYGSALDRMNKEFVTESFAAGDSASFGDCSSPAATDAVTNFGSTHPGGANFLFSDGSVHFLSETIEMPLYRGLSTRAVGEVVNIP